MIDSLIFDLDGTLWDSTQVVADTWQTVIDREGIPIKLTPEKLNKLFGKLLEDIAAILFADYTKERQLSLIQACCQLENETLEKTGGILYPQLEEVLGKLSKKYKLFIVSNCQDGYIEAFLAAHKLGAYFTDYECPGRTGLAKADNIKLIIERNKLSDPVYVGDTQGDRDAVRTAGIPFAYASYGFGTVDSYDYYLNTFSDLLTVFDCK